MRVGEAAEVLKVRVAQDFVFRQAHHFTRRDRHAVQANAMRVDAELAERRVLLAEAEVLARLRRVSPTQSFNADCSAPVSGRASLQVRRSSASIRFARSASAESASSSGAISIPTSPECG